MIPTHWTPYRRADDGEVVGYLAPAEDDLHVPTSLLGHALGEAMDHDDAADLLTRTGLGLLAETWVLDVDGSDVLVELLEVTPSAVVVTSVDFGDAAGTYGTSYCLPVPVGGRLRLR